METILIVLLGLVLISLAAWFWGADSREDVNSNEWQRRQAWANGKY